MLYAVFIATSPAFGFYNPKVGRWMTRDPIGENDSANLYQFVGNNPVKNIDPLGMYTLGDAEDSLNKKGVPKDIKTWHGDRYSDAQLFNEWLALERSRGAWWKDLPKCPSKLCIRFPTKQGGADCRNGVVIPFARCRFLVFFRAHCL